MIQKPTWRLLLRNPIYLLAFGLGSGLSPWAPGTCGTLLGYPLYFGLTSFLTLPKVLFILGILFIFGIMLCELAGRAVGVPDHSGIVWDEIIAMAIILCFTPKSIIWFSGAFMIFRVFDILKPWPINWVDHNFINGFGVMLDDLLAAGYTIIVIKLFIFII